MLACALQELVLVMVIAPSILNPIWSWIIDNLVKDRMKTDNVESQTPLNFQLLTEWLGQDPKSGHEERGQEESLKHYGTVQTDL